jgi:hypothetical protein
MAELGEVEAAQLSTVRHACIVHQDIEPLFAQPFG